MRVYSNAQEDTMHHVEIEQTFKEMMASESTMAVPRRRIERNVDLELANAHLDGWPPRPTVDSDAEFDRG
jgi:hypothetical protein